MFDFVSSGGRVWVLVCACAVAIAPGAARADSREYQIKAAFLENFIQFVTWPSNAFANGDAPFCIGVLGDDPFGQALDQTVEGQSVNHHKIVVQRLRKIEDCKECQMIFVCRSEKKDVQAILAKLDSNPVLTVGETRGFAQDGGMINFYLEGTKLRFEINAVEAQRRKLKISAQLLNLGKIVEASANDK